MACAIALYQQEQQNPVHKKRKKGLWTICKITEIKHQKLTGNSITLNHNTLQNLTNGDHLKANFNATKAWLMQAEEKNIVGIVKEYGGWRRLCRPETMDSHLHRTRLAFSQVVVQERQ